MERAEKKELVATLNQVFKTTGVIVVAHNKGLTVNQVNDLRNKMAQAGATVKVAKNRLAKLALDGTDAAGIKDLFVGPTMVAYAADPVSASSLALSRRLPPRLLVCFRLLLASWRVSSTPMPPRIRPLAKTPRLNHCQTNRL